MPSPFPGMDPYLESPDIWPDLHDALAGEMRTVLNQTLPGPYYARLEMRPEIGIVEDEATRRRIVPDVAVVRQPQLPVVPAGTPVLDLPRKAVSKYLEVAQESEPVRHHYVEILDATQGHRLVTLIEILSPSNKRRGPDRDAYLQKQQEILASDANLIEIDLLRGGERLLASVFLGEFIARLEPPADYLVLVNRAWQRRRWQLFAVGLRELLPCVPIPLRQAEAEILLDMQYVFNRAYDGGPYRRGAVNYAAPPRVPLRDADTSWAEQLVAGWRSNTAG